VDEIRYKRDKYNKRIGREEVKEGDLYNLMSTVMLDLYLI
jgi:hypothetical protein